jgi:hypothetical protein
MGIVKLKDIYQVSNNTCVPLALAVDNLLFHRKKNGRIAFKFYDRITGAGEWISVKAPLWRKDDGYSAAYNSSQVIERAYGKWLKREGIFDETGRTGFDAVNNGNQVDTVAEDFTGKTLAANPYSPPMFPQSIDSLSPSSVVLSIQNSTYFVNNHSYRILGVTAESITVFNPWRIDGMAIVGKNDGFITLNRGEFMADFKGWFYV